jgi:hypothetical protein
MLREGHMLRMCENQMLRRVSGPNMGEIIGVWGKLHNALKNLNSSLNIRMTTVWKIRWARHTAYMRKVLVKYRFEWEGNIEISLVEKEWALCTRFL